MRFLEDNYFYRDKLYQVTVKWRCCSYDDLAVDIEKVRGFCRDGCPDYNKNGGCPPFSPAADEIFKNRDFILLLSKVAATALLEDSSMALDTGHSMLSEYMDKIGYRLRETAGIEFLSPGLCRGCPECTISSGCKNPGRRVYSITGTGIMLGDTLETLFDEKLQWLSENYRPDYIIKVMAFLTANIDEFSRNLTEITSQL